MPIDKIDVVVVGGGHAGCEAASAAARIGCRTLLVTQKEADLGRMSCNPAVGGLAKGHLVKEIDALGGIMGRITDRTSIQTRMLNRSKGPAVWSPRAQCDRSLYCEEIRSELRATHNLEIVEDEVTGLVVGNGEVRGVILKGREELPAGCVVLCGGTFWNGIIHIGEWSAPAGRIDEPPAVGLSDQLAEFGLRRIRLKTGTPPRLDGRSIDFDRLERQDGDPEPIQFSHVQQNRKLPQRPCYLAYSNSHTHEILKGGLDRSPLYTGRIKGVGPRYCPSIEDKIVRFSDKDRHQLFIEPEGLDTDEYYINGFATSLPEDVQIQALRTVAGLEDVTMSRPGYAVEYDVFPAEQLLPALECRMLKNLYLAGQINGTSGYEEAAAQGFMAGVNAARLLQDKEPVILSRDQAYIGVLIDDLITKIPEEPYRMFTSRAEYRLLLRQDNAMQRLVDVAEEIGLLPSSTIADVRAGLGVQGDISAGLQAARVSHEGNRVNAAALLRRPEITLSDLLPKEGFPADLADLITRHNLPAFQAETEIKYEGYLARQRSQIETFAKMEKFHLPDGIDYVSIGALSTESRHALNRIRPATLGQASRIPGVRASDVAVLMVLLARKGSRS